MDLLIYGVVLLAAAVAAVSLSYIWVCALQDALHGAAAPEGGRVARRRLLLAALGWPGALAYWLMANGRQRYSRTRVQ